ncbi:HAD family hydrolase [Spirochaetia bacterium 38H-sp]|uniref:HAD family hydrolase n=1 Tax=Rarispira pelagica TaxID=3141764 RepID=A0ABU9UAQ4_9SPIR
MSYEYSKELYDSLIKLISNNIIEIKPIPTEIEESLPNIMEFDAVVFDIYGTLFISGSGDISIVMGKSKNHFFSEVFSFFNITVKNKKIDYSSIFYNIIEKHQNQRVADGIVNPEVNILEVWKDFILDLKNKKVIDIENITNELLTAIAVKYEILVNPVYPMPGAIEFINKLRMHNKLLGIISNAQFYTPLLFYLFWGKLPEELGFSHDLIIYSYQEKEAKPSKNLFLKVKKELQNQNISPSNVLYIGNDIKNDIYPASQIGFKTALFAGDKRSLRLRETEVSLSNIKPDYIIKNFRNIGGG